jgi:hypothetical protein
MRRCWFLTLFLLIIHIGVKAQEKQGITILINCPALSKERLPELISIQWKEIVKKFPLIKPGDFKVVEQNGSELPFQLEYKGASSIQNLLIPVELQAGKRLILRLMPGKPLTVTSRVFGRYVPERKDDFAWENDRIAFRMYGKALETTNENAFGIDVWAKRTENLILDKWYKSGDYHADHGDGLDYYSVGFTLGAGDIAPYVDGKIFFPKNYRNWKILDNGPLRLSFQLDYDEWDVAGTKVKVTKTFTLDAGSQLNKVEATFSFANSSNTLPVVAGIVKRKEQGIISPLTGNHGLLGYWEPEHGPDGIIGVGTIMLSQASKAIETETHLLQQVQAQNHKAVIYYTGAAWNKAGKITTADEWFRYLKMFRAALDSPLSIKLN